MGCRASVGARGVGVEHPFISTLLQSGPVGQTILAGLLILSIYTWAIIFSKIVALRAAERSSRVFLARFRESGATWLDTPGAVGTTEGPLAKVCHEGLREYGSQVQLLGPGQIPDVQAMERIEAAIEAETVDQIAELERGHLVLAVAASASPFIGLFGTVWGIMNAFRGMGLEGSAGIAAVAPGVAEALVTTVAGLAVAIPAVIAYNLLNRKVQLATALLDRFATDFMRTVHHATRRGQAAPPPRHPSSPEQSPVFARREG